MKRNSKIRLAFAGLLIPLLWMSYNAIEIYNYSKKYVIENTDVAVVLGAGSSNGKVSPVFRERINHGIFLYKTGKVSFLLFTGGFGVGENISDSMAAKNYAIEKGIPADNIYIEEASTVTFDNLKNAKQIMKEKNLLSALIVSDPYHMKRSMAMCKSIEINGYPSPTPTSMYRSWISKCNSLVYESFYFSLGQIAGRYN
ncbi:MAG: YdcF family protein [Bacteroidia bacterium]